jgi:HK97 family phage prohead protease/HK97 family phage major capsid protein
MLQEMLKLASTEAFKSEEAEEGLYIEGYATTDTIDRSEEVVLPSSLDTVDFLKNPILLYQHDRRQPIGKVESIEQRPNGVWIRAYISKSEPSIITKIKEGILKAFSIGFGIKDYKWVGNILYYTDIALREVSIVSIPCNPDALFAEVKEFNEKHCKKPPVVEEQEIKGDLNMDELEMLKAEIAAMKAKADADALAKEKALKEAKDKEAQEKEEASKKLLVDKIDAAAKALEESKAAHATVITELEAKLKTITDELEAVKNAKPKIEFVAPDAKIKSEFRSEYQDALFESLLFKKEMTDTSTFKALPEQVKTMTFDSTFTTWTHNTILEDIRQYAPLLDMLMKQVSQAGTDVYPFEGSVTTGWGSLGSKNYSLDKKISFDYKKIMAGVEWLYEDEEDTIITWMPKVKADLLRAIGEEVDNKIINGTASSTTFRGIMDYAKGGSFEYTMAGTDNALTGLHAMGARALMLKYGVNPRDLALFVNSKKYLQLLKDTNFTTVDKMGNLATQLSGSLGAVYGMNVFVNDNVPGDDTASATNYSGFIFNPKFFGVKVKPILVEMDKNIETQNKVIVASMRVSMIPLLPLTTSQITAPIAVNIVNGTNV